MIVTGTMGDVNLVTQKGEWIQPRDGIGLGVRKGGTVRNQIKIHFKSILDTVGRRVGSLEVEMKDRIRE